MDKKYAAKRKKAVAVIEKLRKFLKTPSYLETHRQNNSGVFKTLIATILSARTRDENTDLAVRQLFSVYKTPEQIANAPVKKIEKLIRPSGFYKTKARYLKETSRILLEEFGGKVPDSIEQLMTLPGVGRKVAGCVLVYGFGKCECIPVDVHVAVVSQRLGWTKEKEPEKIEKDLLELVPKKYWLQVNELFVVFGQTVCLTRNPKCWRCPVFKHCKWAGKFSRAEDAA